MMSGKSEGSKPLAGIRILDLTRNLPGPMCTLHLADLGADVMLVEPLRRGNPVPLGRPDCDTPAAAELFYGALHRNKRSLAVNLKSDAGRDIFLRLAREVDVIVEGFRPGTVKRLAIDYERVCTYNPAIVYCSISGYGQTGPYRRLAGHDINYLAIAGVLDQIRGSDNTPVIPNFQIADLLGGSLTAVMGIMAGLIDAKLHGKGRYVDVSMTDSLFTHAAAALATALGNGAPTKAGRAALSGGLACYNVYRTKDNRYAAIGALEPQFWENLCDALNRADLKSKHLAVGTEQERVKKEIQTIFESQDLAHWTAALSNKDCCFAPVLNIAETIHNEHMRARQLFSDSPGDADHTLQIALPLKMTGFELEVRQLAPRLGEHTDEILSFAGYTPAEIGDLRRSQVVA